jgi:signal transduction histidine kinase
VVDADYRSFLDLIAGHVGTAVANARASEQERRRAEALAELDRAKTAFFSNVSHEFRTPLTLMLGPVEDLLARSHTDLPPAAAGQLEVVHRNGLRLLRLVNTLLDFSRIEAGRVRAVYRPTDLAAFTAELASVFRSACEKAGLRLVVDCPPSPEPVYVDRDMWEKVVLNLLSNAFKFTPSRARSASRRSRPGGRRSCGCGTPAPASRPRSCPGSSSGSTGSRTPGAAPTRAAASAWRWCRSWAVCTAAP